MKSLVWLNTSIQLNSKMSAYINISDKTISLSIKNPYEESIVQFWLNHVLMTHQITRISSVRKEVNVSCLHQPHPSQIKEIYSSPEKKPKRTRTYTS